MKTLLKSLGIARRKSSFGHSDSIGLMDEPAASSAVANSLGVISEAEETDDNVSDKLKHKSKSKKKKEDVVLAAEDAETSGVSGSKQKLEVKNQASMMVNALLSNVTAAKPSTDSESIDAPAPLSTVEFYSNAVAVLPSSDESFSIGLNEIISAPRENPVLTEANTEAASAPSGGASVDSSAAAAANAAVKLESVRARHAELKAWLVNWTQQFVASHGREPSKGDKEHDPEAKARFNEYAEV